MCVKVRIQRASRAEREREREGEREWKESTNAFESGTERKEE